MLEYFYPCVGLLKPTGLKIMCEKSVSTPMKCNLDALPGIACLICLSGEQGWLPGLTPVPAILFSLASLNGRFNIECKFQRSEFLSIFFSVLCTI